MIPKTSDILYKMKARKIRLIDTKVSMAGPAGIRSICRGGKPAPAKFSTIGIILDMIFLDHSIDMKQSDTSVYVGFVYKDELYRAVYDGESISWVGKEPEATNLFLYGVPLLAWTLSDNYKSDGGDEIKEYFRDLKTKADDVNTILKLCDAFYYSFACQEENKAINSEGGLISELTITKGIETGLFTDIPCFEGIDKSNSGAIVSEGKTKTIKVPVEDNDYEVKYDGWSEEQKEKIPNKASLKNYVMTDTTKSIARKIKYRMNKVLERMNEGASGYDAIGSDYINILMVGRPATGKTALANAVAAMTGMPIYTVPFSKHTEEDTAEGKNKVVDGKIGFVETEFLKAYEHGGIIVCEEINLADPGVVMGSIGQAIEKPFILMKDGYIPVRRHPLCVIIGTMNTGTAGSRQLNQALSSRFKCTYTLKDPDKNTFIKILAAAGYPKANCRFVYDAYTKILNYLKDPQQSQEELCDNITLRGCFGALECIEEGDSGKEAINNTLVGKIAEVDLEVAENVMSIVTPSLPDRFDR